MPTPNYQNRDIPSSKDFHVNADFQKRAVIKPEDYLWTPSAIPGVEEIMLDRIDDGMTPTTTVARYLANSEFPSSTHKDGQEIFVLDGSFADEHREYLAGTYVRKPMGIASTLRVGANGSTMFIKSHQIPKNDTQRTVIETNKAKWRPGVITGLQVMPLHEFGGEHVALVRWAPNTQFTLHSHRGGEEILVLDGVFFDEHDRYPKGTWIRSPHLSHHTPFTKQEGALIYVKVGHLLPLSI